MGAAARQGQLWGRAAHDWAELQEPLALPLWETLLDAALVGPGTRVLDAGCGAGGASALAAGRGALVNGLDAAVALLAIARERVPDGDFQHGDLEVLPYANGTFDAIIAADVLAYVAHPLSALRELRRVCAPRRRVVLAIWDAPEACAQHAIVAAVRALLPEPLAAELVPLEPPLATSGVLDMLIGRAALTAIGGGTVTCLYEYPDRETAWQAQMSAGPLQAALPVLGEQRLKDAMAEALAVYATSTGGVLLHNRFRYLIAVPAGERHTTAGERPADRKGGDRQR